MTGISDSQTCSRCLYDNQHPLGLTLDDQFVCSGCRIHEEKDSLDWNARLKDLKSLVEPYRSKTRRCYDCIVPVTGAQDSYFTLHIVKNVLKLNPLLVSYNKYFNTPTGIRNLANLRIKFDSDILIKNVNPHSVKRITRHTLRKYGNMYWPVLAGQTVFPVQTSISHGIPLIIWGAHQGVEQVGMFSHLHNVEMSRRYRKDHDLFGVEPPALLDIFDNLNEEDIWQYRYPSDTDLDNIGTRGIYLSNYIRWDPKQQHEDMIKIYDYKTQRFSRTFDKYDYADCFNYMYVHDVLKLYKHGYSKVKDHACREIRHGRLTREDADILVKRYSTVEPGNMSLLADWLGITINSLKFVMDSHRNPRYWTEIAPQKWIFSPATTADVYSSTGIGAEEPMFVDNKYSHDLPEKYITVGKGFP